jgi:hypothetical protein
VFKVGNKLNVSILTHHLVLHEVFESKFSNVYTHFTSALVHGYMYILN